MRAMRSDEQVIDYLLEEMRREEEKRLARAAKHERMVKLVSSLKTKAAGAGR